MKDMNGTMNRSVHRVLLVGSVVSYAILLVGAVALIPPLGADPWGQRLLELAVVVMMSVPPLRVIVVTLQFGAQKNYGFFLVSMLVLVILCISLISGIK
jgi:uncharacterized membrane protein